MHYSFSSVGLELKDKQLKLFKKISVQEIIVLTYFLLLYPLATSSQVTKPKTKLVVTEKKEYPITTNFPSSLETLSVNGINLKKLDSRMMKLRLLVSLDLVNLLT